MNVLDYILLALFVASTVNGLFKGFIKQALTIIGVFVVTMLTATVTPYVQSWFVTVIENENTRTIVAMIASVLLLIVAYSIVALLIQRILKKVKIIGFLDRLLGALIGFGVVYFVFAVIFALFLDTGESFMPTLKGWVGDAFETSWIGTHIYANNFFGDWVIVSIAEKILNSLQPAV
ncbi:MAG: CvpA family protein [Clostridiales bacterium]|nr:CvpA family protein [Clostridiales bacterium]